METYTSRHESRGHYLFIFFNKRKEKHLIIFRITSVVCRQKKFIPFNNKNILCGSVELCPICRCKTPCTIIIFHPDRFRIYIIFSLPIDLLFHPTFEFDPSSHCIMYILSQSPPPAFIIAPPPHYPRRHFHRSRDQR